MDQFHAIDVLVDCIDLEISQGRKNLVCVLMDPNQIFLYYYEKE